MNHDYTRINARTWDTWAQNGCCWTVPVSHKTYVQAQDGHWDVLLTPCKAVPHDWFRPSLTAGRLDGVRLLGLASGGGQQMPVFAALGADVTILDYSDRQLESERQIAAREGYAIEIVQADMTRPLPFPDEHFDLIFHPVSNCYVEQVDPIWRECHRVLKPGGVLLSGLDNGFNFIVEDPTVRPMVIANRLPFNPLKMPEGRLEQMVANDDGVQFSHTLEEQIGGQLRAGLVLTDVYEDTDNEPDAIADNIPAYWATRAVKPVIRDGWTCFRRYDDA